MKYKDSDFIQGPYIYLIQFTYNALNNRQYRHNTMHKRFAYIFVYKILLDNFSFISVKHLFRIGNK